MAYSLKGSGFIALLSTIGSQLMRLACRIPHGEESGAFIHGVGLVCLLLALYPTVSTAQVFGGERAEGVIVAVRADIVQIKPRFSDALVRVVMDAGTRINDTEFLAFDKIGVGWRLNVMGELESEQDFRPRFLMGISPTEKRTGFFEFPARGIQKAGGGKNAMAGGVVKSLKPLVITDDDGKDIPLNVTGPLMVMHPTTVPRERLLVGRMITANGERTSDGLLRARTISFNPGFGGAGAIFGRVRSTNSAGLQVVPLYVDEPIRVSATDTTVVKRQLTLNPDSVAIGDLITAQGMRYGAVDGSPGRIVASVLLVGKQEYPRVSGGGFGGMPMGGPPAQPVSVTGKVRSLAPLVLEKEDGTSLTITVPGQTPYVDLRPARISDARQGERIMLVGKEGNDGGMSASTIILGASPIVGFGG